MINPVTTRSVSIRNNAPKYLKGYLTEHSVEFHFSHVSGFAYLVPGSRYEFESAAKI